MTGAVDVAGHAYPSGAPDVASGYFCGGSYCKCFSFYVVFFMCIFISLRSCFYVPLLFVVFVCVISILICLVFGFCLFFNNPFTLFLRYSVADTSMNGDKTLATRGRLQLAPKNNVY